MDVVDITLIQMSEWKNATIFDSRDEREREREIERERAMSG